MLPRDLRTSSCASFVGREEGSTEARAAGEEIEGLAHHGTQPVAGGGYEGLGVAENLNHQVEILHRVGVFQGVFLHKRVEIHHGEGVVFQVIT